LSRSACGFALLGNACIGTGDAGGYPINWLFLDLI